MHVYIWRLYDDGQDFWVKFLKKHKQILFKLDFIDIDIKYLFPGLNFEINMDNQFEKSRKNWKKSVTF